MKTVFTDEASSFLREHWGKMPRQEIAEHLGLKLPTIVCHASRLGISKRSEAARYDHLTSDEKAYIAGIVDGEGHFDTRIEVKRKGGGNYTVSLVVVNTHYGLLDWMRRRLPGSYIRERIVHEKKPHWKPQWLLRIHRRDSMVSLINELLPYLVVKREDALRALAAIAELRDRKRR